ncbi:Sec20-domain-containing protein [Panaeolus papilionaceus]|nr:Sec20-domain-containing protein [Panaeolus papilionaceus]
MPPISIRLSDDAKSLISGLERRFRFLQEEQVPKLRECSGPLSTQQTLAEDIREDTVSLGRQIESLDLMVDDQTNKASRQELAATVHRFREDLEVLRADTRMAMLASKRKIDANSKSNRDELFSSPAMMEKQTSEKSTEDALMKANSDVTDALRRTIAMMQAELERSVLTTQMLDSSTDALRSTSGQHDTLNAVMSTSKHLITALEKSDWLDRVLLISAFVFFLLVVLFILKQRILDRSIRIAFWWTRFLPSFSDDDKLLRAMEKGSASVVVASSTVASIASSLSGAVSSSIADVVQSSIPAAVVDSDVPASEPTSMSDASSSASTSTSSLPEEPTASDTPLHVEL